MQSHCRDGNGGMMLVPGLSLPLPCFFYSLTPVSMVELVSSPGMISTAPALSTSRGPHVPSTCGVLASPASHLPPVKRSLMALSVSTCSGQPACCVLDTQAGVEPTLTLRPHGQWSRMLTAPSMLRPLHPEGWVFWRETTFTRFPRASKTLDIEEDILGKSNSMCKGPGFYKNN